MRTDSDDQKIQTTCLIILTTIAVALALYWLTPVLIPFVLALFLAIGLAPLIDLPVRRLHMPRAAAVLMTLTLAGVVLAGVGIAVSSSLSGLSDKAEVHVSEGATLSLDYRGEIRVGKLYFDGKLQPVGTYTAQNAPKYIKGMGILRIR